MKKFFMLLTLVLLPMLVSAKAYTIKVGDLWYKILTHNRTCWVTSVSEEQYAGDIVIPATIEVEGYTFKVTQIDLVAFAGFKKVTSVVIPEGVTKIGMSAFDGCTGLQRVQLPSTITEIQEDAFASCPNLREIRCNATTVPKSESNIFDKTPVTKIKLIVPSSAVSAYKASTIWKRFVFGK